VTDRIEMSRRLFRKAVQQGYSKRRGESYSCPYVEPLSDVRTPLAAFVNSLLVENRMNRLGMNEEFLSIRHTDLVENVGQMMTDRTVGNREGVSNVLIGKTLAEQLDNLSFSGCEAIGPGHVFPFDQGF